MPASAGKVLAFYVYLFSSPSVAENAEKWKKNVPNRRNRGFAFLSFLLFACVSACEYSFSHCQHTARPSFPPCLPWWKSTNSAISKRKPSAPVEEINVSPAQHQAELTLLMLLRLCNGRHGESLAFFSARSQMEMDENERESMAWVCVCVCVAVTGLVWLRLRPVPARQNRWGWLFWDAFADAAPPKRCTNWWHTVRQRSGWYINGRFRPLAYRNKEEGAKR